MVTAALLALGLLLSCLPSGSGRSARPEHCACLTMELDRMGAVLVQAETAREEAETRRLGDIQQAAALAASVRSPAGSGSGPHR